MRKAIPLSLILAVFLVSSVFAGSHEMTATRAEFSELGKLLEGRWITDLVWNAAWTGYGKKEGDKATSYWAARKTADGNAFTTVFYGGTGTNSGIMYYDANAKQIKSVSVTSDGSVWYEVSYKKNGKWYGSSTGSLSDGAKSEGKVTIVFSEDGNSWTHSLTSTVDGKKSTTKNVLRRVGK